MHAPREMNGHTSLDVLKAQRARLKARIEAVQKTQRAVDAREQLAAATQELADFKAAEAHAVEQWAARGCRGERPAPDIDRHAQLLQRVTAAQQVADNAVDAERLLAAKVKDITAEAGNLVNQIRQAAARRMGDEVAEIAARLVAVRAEESELISRLRGAQTFVEDYLNDPMTGSYQADRGAFDRMRALAKNALGFRDAGFADVPQIARWKARLSELVA